MGNNKFLQEFKKGYLEPQLEACTSELNKYYSENKFILAEKFCTAIKNMAEKLLEAPDGEEIIVELKLSLSGLIAKSEAVYYITCFSGGNEICSSEYGASELFAGYFGLYSKAKKETRKYVGKVQIDEVRRLMFENLWRFNEFAIPVIFNGFKKLELDEKFISVAEKHSIKVFCENLCFEYRSAVEKLPVFVKNHIVSNKATDKRNISYNSFLGASFDGFDFSGHSYLFANFEQCKLHNADISGATILKSNFKNCGFKQANFCGANLLGVEFDSCSFSECSFQGAVCFGEPNSFPGLSPVSFKNSVFNNVSFQNCVLGNADFSGAELNNVDFEGTVFKGATFPKELAGVLLFSDEQKKLITIN